MPEKLRKEAPSKIFKVLQLHKSNRLDSGALGIHLHFDKFILTVWAETKQGPPTCLRFFLTTNDLTYIGGLLLVEGKVYLVE